MVHVTKKLITMNLYKIISHPYTLFLAYCFLIIVGEHLAGVYIMYVLLSLPYGYLHSILAIAGIILLFIGHNGFRNNKHSNLKKFTNIIALFLLVASVYYFFWNDPKGYNLGTFREPVALASFIITGIIALCFLINNLPIKTNSNRNHKSSLMSA
jgi:hypothetical protein